MRKPIVTNSKDHLARTVVGEDADRLQICRRDAFLELEYSQLPIHHGNVSLSSFRRYDYEMKDLFVADRM